MAFKKEDLERAVSEKRINLNEDVVWTNDKLVKALGDYTMSHSRADKYTWGAKYMQSLETVQLCRHLKAEQKQLDKAKINPLESDDYVAEFKENGSRVTIVYDPYVGFQFFSRRERTGTYLNGDFTEGILLIDRGIVNYPQDYVGKFNYRFVLDGEITVESGTRVFEDVYYDDIEDFMQAILGSLPERAHKFQMDGNRLIFNIFDALYFEKEPSATPATPSFDYYAPDKELKKDEIVWVESVFSRYLQSAGFTGYTRAKKLYQYLYSLKSALPNDIRKYPFSKRREIRNKLVEFLQSKGLPFVIVDGEDKDKLGYLDSVLGNKCEGIILKNLHAPYISGMKSSRSHRAAMKVKQSITQLLSQMDAEPDFDVFITGMNPPKSKDVTDMIGSLKCSVYMIKPDGTTVEHEIANVSGIPHEWKRELCMFDKDGKMYLNPEYDGKVIAINGMALTHKLKFQHATLFNKGDLVFKDKNPTDCVWNQSELEKMVITRGNAIDNSN